MKTMMTIAITMIAASAAAVTGTGEPRAPRILVDKPGLVTTLDNDGGRVELYARSHAARTVEFHGGAVVREPLVELLFVGTWDKSRAELLRQSADHIGGTDDFQSTHERGVKATAVPITTRTLAGPQKTDGKMNDLDVQSMIDRAIENGSLPSRNDDTIYVLFLSPSIASTLGEKAAGTDYASYHSHFHSHDVNVRYVVVPFHEDLNVMNQAATSSLIRALINPDGDGWY